MLNCVKYCRSDADVYYAPEDWREYFEGNEYEVLICVVTDPVFKTLFLLLTKDLKELESWTL